MNETEKAWLACAIDTDGHVGMKIQKVNRIKGTKDYKYYYVLGMIGFCNTHRPIVEEFGRLSQSKTHKSGGTGKYKDNIRFSTVMMNSKKLVDILEQIIPYMITKKERAKYVLLFCKYKLDNPGDHTSNSTRKEDDLRYYEEYREIYPNYRLNRSQVS